MQTYFTKTVLTVVLIVAVKTVTGTVTGDAV